jgi:hypothetical protein
MMINIMILMENTAPGEKTGQPAPFSSRAGRMPGRN